jgi:hypothetical protein
LTDTEERLEECEQVVKEKESQIRRLKEAVNGLKSSMRDAISERDKWSRRWSRVVELVDKEEEDIADSIVSESTNQASFASVSTQPLTLASAKLTCRHRRRLSITLQLDKYSASDQLVNPYKHVQLLDPLPHWPHCSMTMKPEDHRSPVAAFVHNRARPRCRTCLKKTKS